MKINGIKIPEHMFGALCSQDISQMWAGEEYFNHIRDVVEKIDSNENLTMEQKIFSVPQQMIELYTINRYYQLVKNGMIEKWDEVIMEIVAAHNLIDSKSEVVKPISNLDMHLDKYRNHIRYDKRYNLEYAIKYVHTDNRQVCVGVLIESKNKVLALKAISGRLEGKLTLIQGHVAFIPDIFNEDGRVDYLKPADEITVNAIKEIHEEVIIDEELVSFDRVVYQICSNMSAIDREHIGFIYRIMLTDDQIENIKTNEPEKHDVIIINKDELHKHKDSMDNWLKWMLAIDNKF